MSIQVGEMIGITALICGEMSAESVPVNPTIDIQALKEGDTDPREVVVAVPATKSKRGWNYRPKALQQIVNTVMTQGLPGFLGHQKAENVNTEFPQPVTHWVGAKWDGNAPIIGPDGKEKGKGVAYFRGVIDKSAPDLKRWIKAKTIQTVSIFGTPKLQKVAGEMDVIDYAPLSIDWTPLGRAGMPTTIVATGEMEDSFIGELDGSYEDIKSSVQAAIKAHFGDKSYPYIRKTYQDSVIVEIDTDNGTKCYKVPYGLVDNEIKLGTITEVVRKEVYEPVGEMDTRKGEMMSQTMNWKELLGQLKTMLANKDVTMAQVAGEMGWDAQTLAGEINAQWVKDVNTASETLGKVKEALGVTGEMDVVAVAKDAARAVADQKKTSQTTLVDVVIKEKVTGEMAQGLVKRMLVVPEGSTKEQIAGEIDTILADETVKAAIGKLHVDTPPHVGGGANNQSTNLRTKRQVI